MQDPRVRAQALIGNDDAELHLLWLSYWGNGGQAMLVEFDAFVHGLMPLDAFELKVLAWAMEDYEAASGPRL